MGTLANFLAFEPPSTFPFVPFRSGTFLSFPCYSNASYLWTTTQNPPKLYFVYVCTKDQKLSREKDEKREKERMIKLGLYKKVRVI